MKKGIFCLFLTVLYSQSFAQYSESDTLKSESIQEVIVIGSTKISSKEEKPLSSIDEYLQKSAKIDMVKRGAYAWEPLINNMSTERTLVTIDGMRIFGACTDKMDPVTSYVEVSNLSEATVNSGQEGSCHGNTIGGAVDLKRNKSIFGAEKWSFNVNTGFESANQQKILGTGANFKNEKFYTDASFMMRDAENYKAGKNIEVPFSQFSKINFSGISGVKIGANKLLEASVIYDKATDVGYPALTMDVSLAEALITSLKFQVLPTDHFVKSWESKIYYNTVTHRMDDTKRPNVLIHMDMPGWTKTFGYYSNLKSKLRNHNLSANLNGFYNSSSAEMTMYPTNPNESPMFMFTWPEVKTLNQGIYLEDNWKISENSSLKFAANAAYHGNKVESAFGLNSLQIFYPEMTAQKNRFLKSISTNFRGQKNSWEFGFGGGFGDRAPSVSEGYGFYLFNSMENYDYVGNPGLKNESSLEANAFLGFKEKNSSVKISSSYFHISDYIVGKIIPNLAPMTIGAKGVKAYTALDYATIFNVSLDTEFKIASFLKWNSQVVYSRGKDNSDHNLPWMSPFAYRSSLKFEKNKLSATLAVEGNAKQTAFASEYGETGTDAYTITNLGVGYIFNLSKVKILTKIGVENMFDIYYRTYSDWNNIPRMGRNFYFNLNFNL